ncbi:MAG: phosphomannomutase [Candidatus Saccharibacteria bacterium]|nr:phosphomannomutase [Candidatus Saccharibacteria bacterium]
MNTDHLHDIFKSYDIRGKVGTELTPELVNTIGRVFADWLPTDGIVAVGRDMRPDSEELANALVEGLRAQGRNVWDIGQVTSDMIYFAVGKWNLAGGAVVTASHNPGADNGIKLYRDQVIAVGLDAGLDVIRDRTLANEVKEPAATPGSITSKSITDEWVEHSLTFVNDLKPFHIAIDAGNGMAGAILPSILPKLPLQVEEMYFDLDGTFPNHEANPQKPENLADLAKKVIDGGLDFGIAFDGDGDRAGFVDDKGRPVLGTDLLTLEAKLYLEKYPGSKVVHDVRTSQATQELIAEWGGEAIRTKAGRVNIGTVMRQVGAPFGGETTGHIFFKENYDADSGLLAALVAMQAISDSGKKLSELIDEYRRYAMTPEINFTVTEDKTVIFDRLKSAFPGSKQDELDGLTLWLDNGWFNLRASNTEPVMRLNAEADDQAALEALIAKVTNLINS